MNIYKQLLLIFLLLPALANSNEVVGKSNNTPNVVTLRTPPPIEQGYYVRDLLVEAYQKIGYEIDFISLPATRELNLAQENRISGVLAKDIVVEQNFPELIRVQFPLFEYQVVYVADRRECGYCFLDSITAIGYPRGGQVFPPLIKKFFPNATATDLSWTSNVEEVVSKGRLPSFMTTNMGFSKVVWDSPHTIVHELDRRYDFHYLSPGAGHLREKLEEQLNEMKRSGRIDELLEKHGLLEDKSTKVAFEREKVKAVSGYWAEYTEQDGSGVYWDIVDTAMHRRAVVEKEATEWVRAVRLFENGKADMLVGAYKNLPSGYLSSKYHIDYESEAVSVAKSQDILERFEQGDLNLSVCASETIELVRREASKRAFIYYSEFYKCYELFENDRVDLIVDYPYNLGELMEQFPSAPFYPSLPLYVLFHNNEEGKLLKEQFDQGMERAAKKNKLAELFLSEEDFVFARMTELQSASPP